MRNLLLIAGLALSVAASAQTVRWNNNQTYQQANTTNNPSEDERGAAVYYADYYEGNPTALGETFHQNLMTAAHRKLPLGTIVKVSRVDNGMSTTVRINDRGAFCDGCIIDLSKAAAREIDLLRVGRTQVTLTVIGFSNTNPPSTAMNSQPAEPRFTTRGGNVQPTTSSYDYPAASPAAEQQPALKFRAPAATQYGQINTIDARNLPATSARPQMQARSVSTQVPTITTPISNYVVQLGSYGQIANAERHVLSLQDKGFNGVYIYQETRTDGSLINRVVIAPFTSLAEAEQYLSDLRQYQQMEGLVVRTR